MKKIAIILLMCLTAITAMAQNGWLYGNNIAVLKSMEEYPSGDIDKPVCLKIMLDNSDENNLLALLGLDGDFVLYNFRPNQQYIVVDYGGMSTKWEIETVTPDDKALQYFFVTDAAKFIDMLCKYDFFTITLPLILYGNTTFYFNSNGYPLDW